MASKTRVYDDLLLVVRLCELNEEDFGGEVVNVRQTESDEGV
jgi:hypothetical protein